MNIKTQKNKHYLLDYEEFDHRLHEETLLLKQWLDKKIFSERGLEAGFEIEFLLLDKHYQLVPKNQWFVQALGSPLVVTEAGKAQMEINTRSFSLSGNSLLLIHQYLACLWKECRELAQKNHWYVALIGSMPIAKEHYHYPTYITPNKYYYLMDSLTHHYRHGDPLSLTLANKKTLQPQSLAIEGLFSSFQLHLRVPASQSKHYYNIIQMLSAPMLALCSNAPFFYGINHGSESRISLLEQLYTFKKPFHNLVLFEKKYLKNSLFSLFDDNLYHYPRLLPEVSLDDALTTLFHLRRQNNTIYRWNRPIVDFDVDENPYLRIEHRSSSVGPTIIDMVANVAFYYGIVHYFNSHWIANPIPFNHIVRNFYSAAQWGLNANFRWMKNKKIHACELIYLLIPLSLEGLKRMEIDSADAQYYLSIIQQRVIKQQNGSVWQQKFIHKNGGNFQEMLHEYIKNQYEETPVSQWTI